MTARAPSATQELFGGSARVFVAEAISLPTGLVTAAFLARQFGPSGYGVFTLTMAIVAWLEWTLASLFARPAVKLVADAKDWRPASALVLRMYTASGLLGLAALWLSAGRLASLCWTTQVDVLPCWLAAATSNRTLIAASMLA